ncbi:mitochondrial carrier [Gonapodya prolifera JEL478]|uniref:Mitochondrial carrier n=1 Tax=Gonapodya prolifera (strain JEL478) TaxID=1344416 RepID=A0A139A2C1_GONPJ|nr:mitochondrial carrier [Gonapodya prolifera JEL478]|eukprot:KXS10788.1 mitochondrial carrier [Gonapodya prolifera JEL478]
MSSDAQPVETKKKGRGLAGLKSFISGGVGGICLVLVGHPFDLIKVRLQTAKPGEYSGTLDVIRKAIKADGLLGLYRGVIPPIIGITPVFALYFWGYEMGAQLVRYYSNKPEGTLSTWQICQAGFYSAIPGTLLMGPMERIKIVLQTPNSPYKTIGQATAHIWKDGGVRSLFRGTFATLVRDGPASMAWFATYEVVKAALSPPGGSMSPGAVLFAGGIAGVANWTVAIPPDVIKSRIQSSPAGTYKGFVDATMKTVAAEGPSALFKGLGPAMLRAFPANAANFLGVEVSRKALDKIM